MSISEQARAKRPPRNTDPIYLAFAKVGGGWQKIGAAWHFRSGEEGLSIQVTAIPLNWDGRFILAKPDEKGEPTADERMNDYSDR
jgi:hypothetical protein